MSDDLARNLDALDDEEFERLYGEVADLRPDEADRLLRGFDAPWWIVGGWGIEAFTGRSRPHEDIDLGVLARDLPALFAHFLGTHHVWINGGGTLRPVLSPDQPMPSWLHQIWIRADAASPWLLDIIVAPDDDGRWVFRRNPSFSADLADVTWRGRDGLRYQNPEVTLAFKAAAGRAKDTADLEAALPLLTPSARDWLADTVRRLHPGHRWLDLI